jgi:hypothetical protein
MGRGWWRGTRGIVHHNAIKLWRIL